MESIRMLQDTFEWLYVLAEPLADFLADELSMLSPNNWRSEYVARALKNRDGFTFGDSDNLSDLDVYYLIKIILYNWDEFREVEKNEERFTKEQKRNFEDLLDVRNEIMHPVNKHYPIGDYHKTKKIIEQAAKFLDTDIDDLLTNYHREEKNKILKMIHREVLAPALDCPTLPPDIKTSVQNTHKRLQDKQTAREIVDFFSDALKATRGKKVCDELHKNNLQAFEDIADKVNRAYYGR